MLTVSNVDFLTGKEKILNCKKETTWEVYSCFSYLTSCVEIFRMFVAFLIKQVSTFYFLFDKILKKDRGSVVYGLPSRNIGDADFIQANEFINSSFPR